jgi:hypothetical protein
MIRSVRREGEIGCYYGREILENYAVYIGREVCCLHLHNSVVGSSETMVPVNLTTKYWLSYAVRISFSPSPNPTCAGKPKQNNLNADIPRAGFEPTVSLFENRPIPYTHYKLGRYGTQLLELQGKSLGALKCPVPGRSACEYLVQETGIDFLSSRGS